jgi:hypothetical protein
VEEWKEWWALGRRLFGVWIPIESYAGTKRSSYWFEHGVGCGRLSSSSSYRANSPGLSKGVLRVCPVLTENLARKGCDSSLLRRCYVPG